MLASLCIVPVGVQSLQSANAQMQVDTAGLLQAEIDPDSAYGELIRMVQAGVEQRVVLAYINNSLRFFNLDADKIIYLTDLGAPSEIIEAAMERDRQLIDEGISSGTSQSAEDEASVEEQSEEVTEEDFNDTLAPYGVWVEIDGYGRCWRPTVLIYNSGWQPYCDNGHWVYTDYGWYWISNYSWGWATFHYGRWFNHSRYGWCWWPDTIWAPSWVCWRHERDYCGWAPLPPYTVYRSGVGFVYRGSTVRFGFDFGLNVGAFTFVATRNFCDPKPWRHRIGRDEARRIYDRTSVSHGIDYDQKHRRITNSGIPPRDITAVTRQKIHPVSIRHEKAKIMHDNRYERFDQDKRTLFVTRSSPAAPSSSSRGTGSRKTRQVNHTMDRSGSPNTRNAEKPDHRKFDVTKPSGQNVNRSIPPQSSPDQKTKPSPRVAPQQPRERSNPSTTRNSASNNPPPKQSLKNNIVPIRHQKWLNHESLPRHHRQSPTERRREDKTINNGL